MQEWFIWHAWKACVLQKGTGGSNPSLSASIIIDEEERAGVRTDDEGGVHESRRKEGRVIPLSPLKLKKK